MGTLSPPWAREEAWWLPLGTLVRPARPAGGLAELCHLWRAKNLRAVYVTGL